MGRYLEANAIFLQCQRYLKILSSIISSQIYIHVVINILLFLSPHWCAGRTPYVAVLWLICSYYASRERTVEKPSACKSLFYKCVIFSPRVLVSVAETLKAMCALSSEFCQVCYMEKFLNTKYGNVLQQKKLAMLLLANF